MPRESIYLDHSATTPVDPSVVEAMLPFWTGDYGNPSSLHHHGRRAARALDDARRTVAALIGARPDEIIFTGCGSEADNIALRGVMFAARAAGGGNHLITSAVEHKAVLDMAVQLRDTFDFNLTILPVDADGLIDLDQLRAAIRPGDTALVSIMAANNEIGSYQPIDQAAAIAHEAGALFHSDAIQAAAYRRWDVSAEPFDLLSFAPHKFYGPKGVGILYARANVALFPHLTGGGQEDGRRPGTENVAFAVGAARALALADERRDADIAHATILRDRLIAGVLNALPDVVRLTGHPSHRLPHHASFAFRHIGGNDLLIHLDVAGVSASSGSACATGDPQPSPVLEALGLDAAYTRGGLRLSIGRQNTVEEIDRVIALLPDIVNRIDAIRPHSAAPTLN